MDRQVRKRTRWRLPHWEKKNAVYFVTFRLADSLPQSVLAELRNDANQLRAKLRSAGQLSPSETERLAKLSHERLQSYLDQGIGDCHLRDQRIASIVRDALLHFDGDRYCLHAWCIMPNHVHLIFHLLGEHTLDTLMHSIKSFTAHKANKLLGRTGHFWQREYSNRIVRDAREYDNKIAYIIENPARAGLDNWPWAGRGSCGVEG